jgi:alginate O-acetyltransferase complex protein AlgI
MILGGLWHGASWTFVIWGLYQGILLSINHLFRSRVEATSLLKNQLRTRLLNPCKILITFTLISLGWVLFRAPNLEVATHIYLSVFGLSKHAFTTIPDVFSMKIMIFAVLWVFLVPDTMVLREKFLQSIELKSYRFTRRTAFICAFLSTLGLIALGQVQHFLYSGF